MTANPIIPPKPAPVRLDHDWYVLKTKPHSEEIAVAALKQSGIEVYLPQLHASATRSRKPRPQPLFPGYLFFWLEPDSRYWSYVRWANGVAYLLTDDGGPIPLPAELIGEIQRGELYHWNRVEERTMRPFERGEKLEIVSGPFKGLEAIFDREMSAAGRCQVLINILGRLSIVRLGKGALERTRN